MAQQSKPVEGGQKNSERTVPDAMNGRDDEDTIDKEDDDREAIIKTESTKPDALDAAPGTLAVELTCGYIDVNGKLHDTIIVSEMTGYEEDILAGKGPVIPRLNNIISNCIVQFGSVTDRMTIRSAVEEMTAPDRLASLIAIRRVSLGDKYEIKINCPKCKEKSKFILDLSEIKIIKMEDPINRSREDVLESGKMIKWHVLSATDEEWLSGKQKKKEDIPTLAIMSRVDFVDKEKVERNGKEFRQSKEMIKGLSTKERTEIRQLFRRAEGSVDTKVEFDCPTCEFEWDAHMDVSQPSFFFPSDS